MPESLRRVSPVVPGRTPGFPIEILERPEKPRPFPFGGRWGGGRWKEIGGGMYDSGGGDDDNRPVGTGDEDEGRLIRATQFAQVWSTETPGEIQNENFGSGLRSKWDEIYTLLKAQKATQWHLAQQRALRSSLEFVDLTHGATEFLAMIQNLAMAEGTKKPDDLMPLSILGIDIPQRMIGFFAAGKNLAQFERNILLPFSQGWQDGAIKRPRAYQDSDARLLQMEWGIELLRDHPVGPGLG